MMNDLAHRGPDGAGAYFDDSVALGHRRLSVIDLATGAQPMGSPYGRYHVAFNGEIYNYLELRADLLARGCPLATQSDAEVLLWQLILHGPDGLRTLNGMFALALWDARDKTLLLARDRIGEKPLFYAETAGDLVFASEIQTLFRHPGLSRTVDPVSVAKYLTFGWVPAPHSIYRGVRKLLPGQYAVFSERGLALHTYWDLPLQDRPVNPFREDECAERLKLLLNDSVRLRLRGDVPVGVLLSGGLDSSAVTAFASRASPAKLHSFSIGFDEPSYDESRFARRIAGDFGTEHHHAVMTARDAAAIFPRAVSAAGEPLADASLLPSLFLSGHVARHLKVVMGGDGGDELMAGYPAFQAHRFVNALSFLPRGSRDALTRLAARLPVSHAYASFDFLLRQFLRGAGISPEIRFMLWMGCCGNAEREALLSDEVRQTLLQSDVYEDVLGHVRASGLTDEFQRISYLAFKMYLQDGVLVKVDRASMAHGLEVRAPFLDHRLVEFCCGLHPSLRLRRLQTKHLLKKAMRGILPREIIHRRKAGFMMPVARWLQTDFRPMLEELCSETEIRRTGLFKPEVVRRLVDDHVRNRGDHRKALWALLCYREWASGFGSDGARTAPLTAPHHDSNCPALSAQSFKRE